MVGDRGEGKQGLMECRVQERCAEVRRDEEAEWGGEERLEVDVLVQNRWRGSQYT